MYLVFSHSAFGRLCAPVSFMAAHRVAQITFECETKTNVVDKLTL